MCVGTFKWICIMCGATVDNGLVPNITFEINLSIMQMWSPVVFAYRHAVAEQQNILFTIRMSDVYDCTLHPILYMHAISLSYLYTCIYGFGADWSNHLEHLT